MQWLDKLVDEIVARKPEGEILIESGGSPSGTYHLGHLRELVTSDGILFELRRRQRQARHVYYVDDLDALRKVPVNVPPEFDKYLGRPLYDIPAPDGSDKSYADYFLQGLIDAAKALGIEVEFIQSHKKYQAGFFVPAIERALEDETAIRQILETVSGHKLGEEWSPIQINEDGYLKKRRFLAIDKKAKAITYEDVGGEEQSTSYANGDVKLDWRIDWPARWWLLGVTAEPFGRDHASSGGSYDTGVELSRQVFLSEPPLAVAYDFVNMAGDTKKMSASKGTGLDALGVVKVLPPEIVRYFMLRYPPSKRLYFDPENGVSQLIDEFAELMSKDSSSPLVEISRRGLNPTISRVPFSHLVASYQAALKDPAATIEIIKRTEHGYEADQNQQILKDELKYIDEWLDKWAPEDVKFSLSEKVPTDLSDEEKKYLKDLSAKISKTPADADGEWFHKAVYEFKDSTDLQPKQLFEALYKVLIGKTSGPRAGWFLSILPREWLIKRLRLEA
ncbi:MAG: lysine--tRNA ligase [Candidatus Saccharimonadales bacterium]